jgi:metallophosphoesterase (TIGR00282 family)
MRVNQEIETVRILFLGDLVGLPGRAMLARHLPELKKKYAIDGVIVNGENAAAGKGITPKIMRFLRSIGVDVVTTGNHIWQKRDILTYFAQNTDLLRPANFPSSCPGAGITTFVCKGFTVGVMNMQGRVFMRELLACPFKTAESLLTYLKTKTSIILVDMHAETTSEKAALAYYLDGKVSAVVGTHTHVQTADERVLPGGTAFITDLGMSGALNSVLGVKKEAIIQQCINQMPTKYEVEQVGPFFLTGVWLEIDTATGKALSIERVKIVDMNLHLTEDNNE